MDRIVVVSQQLTHALGIPVRREAHKQPRPTTSGSFRYRTDAPPAVCPVRDDA
jgi:hypothetical protein